ncbi:MAG: sugar phosphate isomerase/epimerase [Armatimonadetes bacterium]|nr:sugar phosphate isomerase/epimerase [Armatimonadota bacterium]
MPNELHPRLAVSSWSLHRRLTQEGVPLLDIPAEAAAHGISRLEVCHFHFPSTDPGYVKDLRGALDDAGVKFFTMLIDAGDLTHPDRTRRTEDEAMIAGWVDTAAACGAERARVIAGDAVPEPDGMALVLSAAALGHLARRAEAGGVRLVTENWHALLDRPQEVLELLEELEGQVGLMLDFGNWKGERKYDDLAQIAPFASSTHCKADYPAAGQINRADFTRCLDICRDAGFSGPHSLIFDGPLTDGGEWASLDEMQEIVRPYLA